MDNNDIKNTVTNIFNKEDNIKSKYSFHNIHNKIMTPIINTIISWVLACFNRYSEQQFHAKMSQEFVYYDNMARQTYSVKGFDFIKDWNDNHKSRYHSIITIIRKTKVKLDKQELHGSILQTMRKHGWTLTTQESQCFQFTVNRLYNIIYHNVDSIHVLTSSS